LQIGHATAWQIADFYEVFMERRLKGFSGFAGFFLSAGIFNIHSISVQFILFKNFKLETLNFKLSLSLSNTKSHPG